MKGRAQKVVQVGDNRGPPWWPTHGGRQRPALDELRSSGNNGDNVKVSSATIARC